MEMRLCVVNAPADYDALIAGAPTPIERAARPGAAVGIVHLFVEQRADLVQQLPRLREQLAPDGVVWVSWPKKASKVKTDITEDALRAIFLPTGLVDVKVAAMDETWSGLKFMFRKELRASL